MSRIGCWGCLLGVAIALGNTFNAHSALAQITPDGTLPNNSIVNINGNIFNITGGTQAGGNLFHSFKDFSVPTGNTAFFNNTVDIANIISRVTGGSVSSIDGLIRTLGTANLFLINPNGIVFGPNASLNVGGSFVATTANAIQFGDLGFFSATNPEAPSPLLTINPSALVSNQIAQAIRNSSVAPAGTDPAGFEALGLRVGDGKSLLLVGGNVNMDGGWLNAYGGRVELGGLASAGTVQLKVDGNNLSLGFPDNVTRSDVSLSNSANVYVEAAGGGSIAVNARNLEIFGGSTLTAGIGQGLGSVGSQAGDISLNATGEIKIVGTDSRIVNLVREEAVGNAGEITINAGSLEVTNGAQINTFTRGQGNGGNITIQARDAVTFDGVDSDGNYYSGVYSDVEAGAVGRGGNIDIQAGNVFIKNGAEISSSTSGRGDSGKISITARDTVSLSGQGTSLILNSVDPGGVGNSGGISINTGSLFASDEAGILSSVNGRGNSGGIFIEARDTVSLTGVGDLNLGITNSDARGTIFSSTVNAGGVGSGGDVVIKTGTLRLDSSQINTSTAGTGNSGNLIIEARDQVALVQGSDMFSEVICACERQGGGVGGNGNGGDIRITTGSLLLDIGANLRADTEARGNAGNIIINARDSVTFKSDLKGFIGGAYTQVEPEAVGIGGDITINTGTLSVSAYHEINTRTQGQGEAGNIFINADAISLTGSEARIISAASQDQRLPGTFGNGGDINIKTNSLLVTDGAKISADSEISRAIAGDININASRLTLNQGTIKSESVSDADGGNINLNTDRFLLLRNNSQISTNAGTAQLGGNGGNITINTPLLVAVPGENSDITANAFSGRGGQIEINTSGLFGIEPRFELTEDNDITAFSQSGISGEIAINRPNVEQRLESVELPTVLADISNIIDTSCAAVASTDSDTEKNKFTITGRGGLPPSPYEPLNTDVVWLDTRLSTIAQRAVASPIALQQQRSEKPAAKPPSKAETVKIVPATGWVFDGKGHVTLISHTSGGNGLGSTPARCPKQ
ncbi:filamentous hemagglutinin N-terminal domain-containing protein [Scytonema sp. PRP1]